jgi:hypothetical protein
MKHTTILRILIAVEVSLGVLGIAADFALETMLPAPIQDYIAKSANSDLTLGQASGLGIGVLLIIGLIVGWVGLWKLWRPARTIYTICWLAGVPLYLLLDPVVYYTPAGAMLGEYSVLAAGAILSLVFFSDLSSHFNRTKAE